ncbi:expressed unknown protein [Seminavis robusta]|uniref:Uncharacterized protein n=1 Tax=Seminavis robusta TaxID=568900 RepID=A0A9N8H800_9STRA|nr:expressed unknown protein [Seminavis robusta]|eukprot:Sro220_g090720.1 n/a (86) ;mRNA; f:32399-33069
MKLSTVAFFLLACLTSQVSAESDVLDKVQLLLNGDRERELKGFNIPKPTPAEAPHPAPTPKAPTYITGAPSHSRQDQDYTLVEFH